MPGMFSRRRGSSAAPPANRSTMSAATAAASQAYINKQSPATSSLSSAAAAAALRSHTTTPEPIGNLQTKRMMRRGSVTSVTSNGTASIAGRPGLQRQNSSGSMTERTFRSSSRSPSRNGAASPAMNAPPIPPLPKTLRNGSRRSSSTEPPERVLSPTPVNGRRSMSVDKPTSAAAAARPTLAQVPEVDGHSGTGRRSSVNFSRPRVGSPEPSDSPTQTTAKKGGWFGGPTGSIAQSGASIQQVVNSTAKPGPVRAAPAPLNTAAPAQEMEETMVFDPASRTFVKQSRPKPAPVEPPSPIVDTAPKLKPGDYDPATRSIVPHPVTAKPAPAQAPAKEKTDRPMSPRPTTTLHKQPSVVREDPEAERKAEAEAPKPAPRAVASSQGQAPAPAKSYTQVSHQRSSSLDVPGAHGDRGRGGSLSPSRSARFSASPIVDSTKHEPHRGISPAKSAMKHSPSSSIRTASPVATFSPAVVPQSAASDISDTTSLTSADGSAAAKKRRSVKVSFDEDTAKAEPVPAVPAAKTVASRPALSDDEQDEAMQPRPDLPTFGSIRRNRPNEAVESPDRKKGGLESLFKKTEEPVPPEVTSKDAAPAEEDLHESEDVPAINLHPPTPAIDDEKAFTDDEGARMSDSQELRGLATGVIFYGEESDDSRARKLADDRPAHARKDSDADEYADAPETQDAGQPGFASLDAIVESPLTSPVKETAPIEGLTTMPDSPSKGETDQTAPDWTAASAHWSNISKQQKAQHELGQLSSDDEVKTKRSFFKRNKKPKEAPAVVTAPAPPVETKPPSPPPSQAAVVKSVPSNASQPLKPALKKPASVTSNDDTFHMPRTMRGNDGPSKKSRPASAQITGSPTKATKPVRPASTQYDSFDSVSGRGQPRAAAPIAAGSLTASKLSKKFQDDSDSESSFRKKKRPTSTVDSKGRYTMKRSMRAGSVDSSQRMTSPTPTGRARTGSLLRSLSPSSVTSDRPPSMRTSMRGGPPDAGARTLRNAPKNNNRPSSSGMASRFKSRFVDSDDEDDRSAAKPSYRSRFVDSDEDDTIPEELTPVRGIPRRKGQEDGDSTDLDDESDNDRRSPKKKATKGIVIDEAAVERAMEAARRKVGVAQPTSAKIDEGSTLREGTMRNRDNDKVLMSDVLSEGGSTADPAKKKKSFMGSLLRRNKNSSQTETTPTKADTKDDSPTSPSSARLQRRSSYQQPPKLQRGNSSLSTATAPPAHGRPETEHWPLPPPIPNDKFSAFSNRNTDRPQTSDESMHSKRPAERPEARRSFSARVGFTDDAIAHSERDESVAGTNSEAYSRRTGKKKKFGLLRRAFGLYD